jgi:hypothetical protein
MYFDGVSQTLNPDVAPSGTATSTAQSLRIGNRSGDDRNFDGSLADMAIWNRVLTQEEIDALADGLSPDCITTGLVLYAPLIRDVVNLLDNSSPTTTGTAVQPHPRVYSTGDGLIVGKTVASTGSVGAAAGTGAASGVGASTAAATASAAGTGSASGVGASTAASVGSAAGTGAASGVGRSTAASVGSSAGTGAASGVGAATAASVGSAAGTGAASGVGKSTAASVGSAAGTGAASGVGASTAAAVGSAAGTGTATGSADNASVGAASGTGAASGVGASTAAAIGAASGTGTASAVGAATANAVGTASGTGTAAATAAEPGSVGVASGTGAATGVGASIAAAIGLASGTGDAIAIPFVEAPQQVQGGFELAGNYGVRAGEKKRRRKTEEELRAERFREIIREVEIASGLRPPQEPDARSQDSDAGPSGGSAAAPGAEDTEVPDTLSLALLDRLLALPAEEIRLPIEPFPHILSAGRAAAIEAARLHAIRLRDDEAAIAAILAAMVL